MKEDGGWADERVNCEWLRGWVADGREGGLLVDAWMDDKEGTEDVGERRCRNEDLGRWMSEGGCRGENVNGRIC